MWEGLQARSVLETVHSPIWLEQEIGEGRSEELEKQQAGHEGPPCPLRGLRSMLRAMAAPKGCNTMQLRKHHCVKNSFQGESLGRGGEYWQVL